MNYALPTAAGADSAQQQQPQARRAADPHAPSLPSASAPDAEPFSMLVDLNLTDDAFFLDLDAHDSVLELQAFDVSLDATAAASVYGNGSAPSFHADANSSSSTAAATVGAALKPHATPFTTALDELLGDTSEPFTISASAPVAPATATTAPVAPSGRLVRKQRERPSGDSKSASSSPASSVALGGAAASASIEDDRRKRHNANERRRTNALKSRILTMRDELAALEQQREQLQASGIGGGVVVPNRSSALVASSQRQFLEIVTTIDRLRREKAQLLQQLQTWDMQNSTYQTILTEFRVGGFETSSNKKRLEGASSVAVPALFDSLRSASSSDTMLDSGTDGTIPPDSSNSSGAAGIAKTTTINNSSNNKPGSNSSTDDGDGDGDDDDPLTSEDAPIFQKILFATPMALPDALECVRSSYNEIMAFRRQSEFDSLGGEVLGWRDKRLLDADSLQFMLAQHFDTVLAHELVYKTWNLLTTLVLYRRIQPRTTQLQILQRVNNDCVIVRLSVGSGEQQHHTILLIARGRIDGGFLITYRSIPLSEAKQRFAETEGTYVSIFNWFMFLDKASSDGSDAGACEVIFGGKVKNRSAEYLRYLMMEVVAGVVRWQTAVGHSKFRLMN